MRYVCKKCGYSEELGKVVELKDIKMECPECGGVDIYLIDTGGIEINLKGISPEFAIDTLKSAISNLKMKDVIDFLIKIFEKERK